MAGPNMPTRVMMFRDFVPDKGGCKLNCVSKE